jgi:hypothetical protein
LCHHDRTYAGRLLHSLDRSYNHQTIFDSLDGEYYLGSNSFIEMTRNFVPRLMAAHHNTHDDAYYFEVADRVIQKQVFHPSLPGGACLQQSNTFDIVNSTSRYRLQ